MDRWRVLILLIWTQSLIYSSTKVTAANEGCTFELNKNTPKSALILKNQPAPEILYPDHRNTIHIPSNSEIRISCAGKYLDNLFYAKDVTAKCIKDDLVQVKYHILAKKQINLDKLECKTKPTLVAHITEKRCYSNGIVVEIGYQTSSKSFLKIYSVCWDDFEEKAVYSWYSNGKLNLGQEEKIKNVGYEGSQSYSFSVADVYEYSYQKKLFTRILRSEELADRYIVNNYLFVIVPSQLMTKGEFVYGPEQIATFHYMNTAPQWSIFKEGNWAKVEKAVNDFVGGSDRKIKYGIATGTYDIATLPNIFQEPQPLYMFTDKYNNNYLPIPKYYWKILYDQGNKIGIAFIGVHNPFVRKENITSYVFCKDICDQVSWFKVDNAHLDRGYVFCCDMKEFLEMTRYENMFEG